LGGLVDEEAAGFQVGAELDASNLLGKVETLPIEGDGSIKLVW
jgi:hypothetical protein